MRDKGRFVPLLWDLIEYYDRHPQDWLCIIAFDKTTSHASALLLTSQKPWAQRRISSNSRALAKELWTEVSRK